VGMIITWKAFFIAYLCNPFSSIIVSPDVQGGRIRGGQMENRLGYPYP